MTIIDGIFLKRLMIDIRLRQIFKIENHSKNLLSPPRRQPPTINYGKDKIWILRAKTCLRGNGSRQGAHGFK